MENFFRLVDEGIGADLQSERVKALFGYWQAMGRLPNLDGVPFRSNIDPAHLKPILPYLLIVGLSEEPLRLYYRLVGTEVVRHTGLEFTGRHLDEMQISPKAMAAVTKAYAAVRDARRCGVGVSRIVVDGKKRMTTEFLICPLTTDGSRVDQCLVIEDYFLRDGLVAGDLPPALRV
jgi:hypothetical protein